MTDEEKAEEYLKELILKHNRDLVLRPKNAVTYIDELKQAVLYGLAEGRKEGYEQGKKTLLEMNEVLDSIDAKAKIKSLEKENARLNRDKTELVNSVTELTNKVTELEGQKDNIELAINESEEIIAELKEQIEKMKSFIHSEIDFCMYCPLTENCKNDEGTCPYAGISEDEQKKLLTDWVTKIGS